LLLHRRYRDGGELEACTDGPGLLEVRWVRRVAEPPGLRLGGRFAGLDKRQEMLIEHFVRQAERELLKRR
jgi:hypothetical protein